MKLLTKEDLQEKKSFERKKEIDEGVKLAKKVDTLRELSVVEQANLTKFRDETLNSIKNEITLATTQYNALQQQIKQLEEDRMRKMAPIDLTKEWEQVKNDKLQVEEWKRELFDREANVILREGKIITSEQDFDTRNKQLIENETKAKQYLEESNKSYRVVEEIRTNIEIKKDLSDKEVSERYNTLLEKEQQFAHREQEFKVIQDQVEIDKKEMLERGTSLINREGRVELKEKELFERDETLKQNENLNQRYLIESKSNYDKTEKLRLDMEKNKEESDKDVSNQYKVLAEKEIELGYKERDLNIEKEQVAKDKQDIVNERIHITSQQETLKVAWNNIKRLK